MEQDISIDLPDGITQRLDQYIAKMEILSRAQIKTRNLQAEMEGKAVKLSLKVKKGMQLHLTWDDEQPMTLEPEDIPLDILYEDESVLVLNKPQGLVVHPAIGNWTGTLVQGLLFYLNRQPEVKDIRPGIVHRLDKDTSGVIITAKSLEVQEYLSEQFRNRDTHKVYLAVLKGRPPKMKGSVEGYISRDPNNRKRFTTHNSKGKWSISHFSVKKIWKGYSLVEIEIETGRTHQIRVHMQSLGCPVLGDSIYGRKEANFSDTGLMLHSWKLSIKLPGHSESDEFTAPLPERFESLIQILDRDFVL